MTPKEKAQELVDKMYHYQWREKQRAKECALIAVDEVMNADWYIPTFEDNKKWTSYWKEVEQEIEKL